MDAIATLIAGLAAGLVLRTIACWAVMRSRTQTQMPENAREQIQDAVRASAAQAFQENNASFLDLANERLNTTMEAAKGDFNQRHEQFQALVKPLVQDYQSLNPQIKALTEQTSLLAGALTNNRAIGNWGEVQLRRVAELAGMTDYCDFSEQHTLGSGERPDMIVRLPDKRTIIIDAKASVAAYLEAQQQQDQESVQNTLKRHAGALRTQVDDLSKKGYGDKEKESLDFVVMFVPGDQFLAAALQEQPTLVEYAMAKRVAIATPASLISLLWALAHGWQQERIARDAQQIQSAGEEMHKRMMSFINHYDKVGKGIEAAMKSYNASIGTFDRTVVPQGRRFAQLTIGNEDAMDEPAAPEDTLRVSRYSEQENPDGASDTSWSPKVSD